MFSNLKQRDLQIVKNGGWHFTNVKTPEEIFEKLSNFGHHNEFEESGISINDIKESIKNKFVNYDHSADLRKKINMVLSINLKILKTNTYLNI